ncbi:hypothetical protein TIFTF001_021403 [Ficus carica]|uniref:Uncharacterized protein n=1 Tax=Ficus carica TaxID=3494 RepID=A0AA88ASI4_FICCA|nr:hypothetical protein TIFTF001_021403 [Ficus carica]
MARALKYYSYYYVTKEKCHGRLLLAIKCWCRTVACCVTNDSTRSDNTTREARQIPCLGARSSWHHYPNRETVIREAGCSQPGHSCVSPP